MPTVSIPRDPLFAALGFFAVIVHRFFGSLPSDVNLDLEQETLRWGKVLRDAGIKPTP